MTQLESSAQPVTIKLKQLCIKDKHTTTQYGQIDNITTDLNNKYKN